MKLDNLFAYMDDNWAVSPSLNLILFQNQRIPLNQSKFPNLFCFLGIPWAWEKQISGQGIDIIGHHVSSIYLSFSLPSLKKSDLFNAIKTFTLSPSHPLIEWSLAFLVGLPSPLTLFLSVTLPSNPLRIRQASRRFVMLTSFSPRNVKTIYNGLPLLLIPGLATSSSHP